MSIEVILQQTLIIFGYVLIGWVLCKTGIATGEHKKFLSTLITSLTLPLSILASTNIETHPADLLNMLWAALLIVVMVASAMGMTLFAAKRLGLSAAMRAITAGLCGFPNSGFMGIPLCVALMGEWGSLYGAAVIVGFNLMFFTWQASLFHPEERFRFKSLLTVLNLTTVAALAMMALGLHLPGVVQTVCSNVGNMTTPLALIVVGIMLGEGNLLEVFRGKYGYLITLLRNVVWPLLMLALLSVLPLDSTMRLAVMVFAVTPCANLTAVFATQYDMEAALCGRTVLLSTLLSIVTMPLILTLAQAVLH